MTALLMIFVSFTALTIGGLTGLPADAGDNPGDCGAGGCCGQCD